MILYQRVERHRCEVTDAGWSIRIPAKQVLDQKAMTYLAIGVTPDDESRRRFRFAVDKTLMEKIGEGEVYFVWESWVNKHLGLRHPKIYIGSYESWGNQEPDVEYPTWYLLGHDIADAMETYFPWLEYEYAEEVKEDPEVESHALVGRLSGAALGYLKAEEFFHDGSEFVAPEPTYAMDEHDKFLAALETDWQAEAEEAEAEQVKPEENER